MSEKFVKALNTVSGKIGSVPVSYLDHPHFKNQLVLVEEGAKSYATALYKPKTSEEFAETTLTVGGDESYGTTDEDNEEDYI